MNLRRPRGLSMIEMMFAMVILFLVGAFIMNMFATGSYQLAQAGKREKLEGLSRSKTSELRLVDFLALAPTPTPVSFPPPDNAYQYQVTLSNFGSYPPTEARLVDIAVSHPTNGTIRTRLVRWNVPPLDPGQVAFNKFGCASCHSLAAAGYPPGPTLVPLDAIGVAGNPRPFQTDPSITLNAYIVDSVVNPGGFDAYPNGGGLGYSDLTMTPFQVEGYSATYDPSMDVSAQEMTDLANWVAGFNP